LTVDAHGNSLTYQRVIEWLEGIGHSQVHNVRVKVWQQLQGVIGFDGFKVVGADVGDEMNIAGLKFD
jgi:hypothetical protein